jgi:hypothetical protein
MQRVVEGAGTSDFWALAEADNAIPSTTPQYVARVLAAAHVLKRLSTFGFRTPDTSVEATDTLIVPPRAAVWQVARAAGMSEPELRALNPEILGDVFPDVEYELSVLLPRERTERARIMIPLLVADASDEMSSEMETAIR